MKILIIGNGGREHALAWKFLRSERVKPVFCIPGNGGTASLHGCINVSLRMDDFEGIRRFAEVQGPALTIVGPEVPLAAGIVDYFQEAQLPIFGPTKAGARIEASKSWAKELIAKAGVPTAPWETFTDRQRAWEYIAGQTLPIVIKEDGLAAGKGVTIANSIAEAQQTIDSIFAQNSQAQIVIEEFLQGEEVSVLAVTDGETIRPLLAAQDHKRIGEGDTGLNTGGMGAYAPAPIMTPQLQEKVQRNILEPTLQALKSQGIHYCGCLYAGLMITPQGDPKVIEFNCRFGDPETQAILPLLETPLEALLTACWEKRLDRFPPLTWRTGSSACVIIASEGYPGSITTDRPLQGLEKVPDDVLLFHAGTKKKNGNLLTSGGRVLGVTAIGTTLGEALDRVYHTIDQIHFEGMYFRRDIGWRALTAPVPQAD